MLAIETGQIVHNMPNLLHTNSCPKVHGWRNNTNGKSCIFREHTRYLCSPNLCSPVPVKRGDFDNLIKLIISIPNSCSHSSDCRLFILPCLSDWDTTSNVMNVHYLVSRTHNCIDMLGILISRFNGTIHIYKHTVNHNHSQNHCN